MKNKRNLKIKCLLLSTILVSNTTAQAHWYSFVTDVWHATVEVIHGIKTLESDIVDGVVDVAKFIAHDAVKVADFVENEYEDHKKAIDYALLALGGVAAVGVSWVPVIGEGAVGAVLAEAAEIGGEAAEAVTGLAELGEAGEEVGEVVEAGEQIVSKASKLKNLLSQSDLGSAFSDTYKSVKETYNNGKDLFESLKSLKAGEKDAKLAAKVIKFARSVDATIDSVDGAKDAIQGAADKLGDFKDTIEGSKKGLDKTVKNLLSLKSLLPTQISKASTVNLAAASAALKNTTTRTGGPSGVSSGDGNSVQPGVWLSTLLTSSVKRAHKHNPGYKMHTSGFTLGGDVLFENDVLAGVSTTYSHSVNKEIGRTAGHTSNAKSLIVAAYGSYHEFGNCGIEGILLYGNTRINSETLKPSIALGSQGVERNPDTGFDLASAKYNARVYAIHTNVSYKSHIEQIGTTVIPNVGVRYSYFDEDAYTETGSDINHHYHKKTGIDKGIISPGLKLRKDDIVVDKIKIIPEIFGSIDYTFRRNNPETGALFANAILLKNPGVEPGSRDEKTEYNLGFGITSQSDRFEIKAGYTATFASKFIEHHGNLKLRINL
ncbi:autotransporter outer membrane beta-barrel domain-containing protein [Rickettsiaceae bacterium]|nr:autotransporter outer membrane beta-barrel domain-containing protein [Rickettsiaceae bacterium]